MDRQKEHLGLGPSRASGLQGGFVQFSIVCLGLVLLIRQMVPETVLSPGCGEDNHLKSTEKLLVNVTAFYRGRHTIYCPNQMLCVDLL